MKGKRTIRTIGCSLLVFAMLFTFGACNDEDNVMEIFNGKTWKLTRLTTEGSKRQFYESLWVSEKEEEASREALRNKDYFTLNFNLAQVNQETTGTAEARGIGANINDASVTVNGKTHALGISGKMNGSETDKLAKVFINGLLTVFKYEGDSKSLTIYFKDGNATKIMGFAPQ